MLAEWQVQLQKLKSNRLFEVIVLIIILLSALLVGVDTYDEVIHPDFKAVMEWLDFAVTLFFLVEILIRFLAEENKKAFFKNGWNVFDTVIVTISLIPVSYANTVILGRLLRIFRVLRMVSIVPELRLLINSLLKALPQLAYVMLLLFIIFYIYGALGSTLFHAINEQRWGNISVAMLTLFEVMTFEGWADIMYETMRHPKGSPWAWIYYLSFIFFSAFAFLNMILGIVLKVMENEHRKLKPLIDDEPTLSELQQEIQELKAMLEKK